MSATFPIPPAVSGYCQGRFVAPTGTPLPIRFPGNDQVISQLHESDAAEVDQAVRAARTAFDQGVWRRQTVAQRQHVLRRIADLIDQHRDELAYLECMNSGIPMRHLQHGQIPRAAYNFRFFAEFIGQHADSAYDQEPNLLTVVIREPVGVAALIGPWNAPLALTSMKIAGAIAFGNSCVCKPSEVTPLAVARLMTLLSEAGVPDGVVNLVNGRGHITGQALVAHPEVDLVSFTGGTETARHISASAGQGLKPLSLELGGKSANIIHESCNLERAIDGALLGIFSNNGQQCLAGSRILVQRSVLAPFLEAFVTRAQRLRLGDPLDPATEIGPLAFRAHRDRVASFVDMARADGAQILCGGQVRDDLEPGYFFAPTVVLTEDPAARICQQEVFGPFATVVPYDTLDEAIRIANHSRFGLVSYLWCEHYPSIMRVMREVRAGLVWVNTPMTRDLRAPFGGVKESGYGREGGDASMKFYTYEKTVMLAEQVPSMTRLGTA